MSKKKKIGVFIDWYLPGYKAGGPIRSCANMISHLGEEFDFHVITRNTDYTETEPLEGISSNEWNTLADGTQVYYFSAERLTRNNMNDLIAREQFDAVYINGIYSYYFSILPLGLCKKQHVPKIVVAARGMFAPGAIKVKGYKKRLFLAFSKLTGRYKNVVFHATNEQEKHDIEAQLGSGVQVAVAPNLPKKYADLQWQQREKTAGELKLVNVARIAPEKNLKYALEVLCKVKSKVSFDVYGPVYNENYWQQCRQVALPKNVNFSHKGSVSNDKLATILPGYHALLMPTRGENFGHIILEALAAGTPVIISDKTPWQGLADKNTGADIPLDEPACFTATIEKIAAMEQQQYDAMSLAAYNYAVQYINDKEAVEKVKKVFG